MKAFDRETLGRSLALLPPWKKLAFMALTSERMLPNFQRFSSETGFGNASSLRQALDVAWIYIREGKLTGDPEKLKQVCEAQAPNTELFTSIYTSAALDAANSVAAIMDAIRNPTTEFALEVAELARDTVDLFVQETNDLDPRGADFEQSILESPLMQRELQRQKDDLNAVVGCNSPEEIPLHAADIRTSLEV
jgi:uncharacterized protein YjaG (DUF416 family)